MLFSTESYAPLCRDVAKLTGKPIGQVESKHFPDHERYLRVRSNVRDQDVVLFGGTVTDADTLDVYDLASGLVECGARSLTLVIPYFGYATMERATKTGEVVTAKTRARLLSSLPLPGAGSRIVLLDLHAEGIPFYFEGSIRPVHLYAKSVILEAIQRIGTDNAVMACTDAGRAKWVESLANDLGLSASFIFKRRLDGEHTEVAAISAHVEGKRVILYDDMIRTGSSLLGAARAYRDAGATAVYAVATHGVFPDNSLERVVDSGLFEKIVCTDSHPRVLSLKHAKLEIVSVAPVFADYLAQ